MDRIERLLALHDGDSAAVLAELDRDRRLHRLGFAPARPPRFQPAEADTQRWGIAAWFRDPADLEREALDALIADGMIDPHTGERISRDEHGRTWRRDPWARRWYRLDMSGRRIYDPDD